MSSLADPSAAIERRVNVRYLGALGGALARSLGETGLGGAAIASVMETSLTGECVICSMEIQGADLMAVTMAEDHPDGLTEKQRRIRLGYCARRGCASDYYILRLGSRPDIDWNLVWARTEEGIQGRSPGTQTGVDEEGGRRARGLLWMQWLLPRLRQPLPIGVAVILASLFFLREGCRIPGISPAPRVFMVPESVATSNPPVRR